MGGYRVAILGAGQQGMAHARAYRDSANMAVVALCDLDRDRLDAGLRELDVRGYADFGEMLAREQPDVVHAVTVPSIPRAQWVQPAARAGAKVLVIEKPIALRPKEAAELAAAQETTGLPIIVNHQRRYLPFLDRWEELQAGDALGDIHFVRAATDGVSDMATHLMDLVLAVLGDQPPVAVWATAGGACEYHDPTRLCPDNLLATYTFPGGVRVLFEAGTTPLGTSDFPGTGGRLAGVPGSVMSLDVWGTRGRCWWRERGSWGYQTEGMAQPHIEQTSLGQAMPRSFQSIAEWLERGTPHRCRLDLAQVGFQALIAGYRSALYGRRLEAPIDSLELTDAEWEALREQVAHGWLDVREAAAELAVSEAMVCQLIERGQLQGHQPVPYVPWVVRQETLAAPALRAAAQAIEAGSPARNGSG